VRADSLKIWPQEFGDRRGRLGYENARDSLAPFRRACRLIAGKIVSPGSGVSIDEAERRVLPLEVNENAREDRVLEDVGEIARVKGVAVVDLSLLPFRPCRPL